MRAVDNDGHYTVQSDGGAELCGVRRESLCLKWQVGSSPGAAAASVSPDVDVDGDDERRRRSNGVVVDGDGSDTSRSTSVPAAEDIKRLAALVGIALYLVLYLKTQFYTRSKTRGFNLGFIPQVSNQV